MDQAFGTNAILANICDKQRSLSTLKKCKHINQEETTRVEQMLLTMYIRPDLKGVRLSLLLMQSP